MGILCPQASFLRERGKTMKKRVSFLLAAFILVMSAGVFTGCDSNVDGGNEPIPMPEALKGTWVSSYGEEYIISSNTFTSKYGDYVSYAGTIVNVREDGANAGYITIKYTENSYYTDVLGIDVAGNYYVIHYKNLSSSSVELSGAADGEGKATLEGAETEYTVILGQFTWYSALHKTGSTTKWPNELEGSWSNTLYSETFIITDETIVYQIGGYSIFYGEIVNVRDNNDGTGFITFRYIENGLDDELVGKYCVLYWENYVASTSADIAIASYNWTFGDEGEDTKETAEAKYTADNDDYFEIGSIETCYKD